MHTVPTAATVIDRARAARALARQAAVDELEAALDWAHLHSACPDELPAHWGDATLHAEGVVTLAGAGAPLVAEFAPAELAAALGISREAGAALVADALELGHRLPRLWGCVRRGEVEAWRARRIAEHTRDLSPEAADDADCLVSACPAQFGQVEA